MKMNLDALKALELKLDEYSKENGAIAEHESSNINGCKNCFNECLGSCKNTCAGSCEYRK